MLIYFVHEILGNLPTERVTKRDLFHLFHKYGKLAQISIKQAFGFIQFVDPDSCHRALQAQQHGLIRGRKIRMFFDLTSFVFILSILDKLLMSDFLSLFL